MYQAYEKRIPDCFDVSRQIGSTKARPQVEARWHSWLSMNFVCSLLAVLGCAFLPVASYSSQLPVSSLESNSQPQIQLGQTAPYALLETTANGPSDLNARDGQLFIRLGVNQVKEFATSGNSGPIFSANDRDPNEPHTSRVLDMLEGLSRPANHSQTPGSRSHGQVSQVALLSAVLAPELQAPPEIVDTSKRRPWNQETSLADQAALQEALAASNEVEVASGAIVIRENHLGPNQARLPIRGLSKSNSSNIEHQHQTSKFRAGNGNLFTLAVTAPPVRVIPEVAMENYTSRRIGEEANMFAWRLLRGLNGERLGSSNLIVSPFTVYQGLTLLLAGASGDTLKELDRILLGSLSSYENPRVFHEQDRSRLLGSLSEVIGQLQIISSGRVTSRSNGGNAQGSLVDEPSEAFVVANNLLVAERLFEISPEFQATLDRHYGHWAALTPVQSCSSESIQSINNWIRHLTAGQVPAILDKRQPFDEHNVMTLLTSSWIARDWEPSFHRVNSPVRGAPPTLRGQQDRKPSAGLRLQLNHELSSSNSHKYRDEVGDPANFRLGRPSNEPEHTSEPVKLLEFFDDDENSHFVEFIKSQPSKLIQHYQSQLIANFRADLVIVPLADSNQRFVAIMPRNFNSSSTSASTVIQPIIEEQSVELDELFNSGPTSGQVSSLTGGTKANATDGSLLTRFVNALSESPRKATRALWSLVAPDIITKQSFMERVTSGVLQQTDSSQQLMIREGRAPLVELSIPIFRSQAESSITAALNQLGIVNAFDANQANFININGHPFNYHALHLTDVLYKTTFNLNEFGINYDKTIKTLESMRITDAKQRRQQSISNQQHQQKQQAMSSANQNITTTSTSSVLPVDSRRELDNSSQDTVHPQATNFVDQVQLNRPFLYLICDIKSRLILYSGLLRNPNGESS